MAPVDPLALMDVLVCFSPQPREVDEVKLQLAPGSTVAEALDASGLLTKHGLVLEQGLAVGVWMKLKPLDTVLRQDDRVEIYRGLKVDPKEARRQRYRKQSGKAGAA